MEKIELLQNSTMASNRIVWLNGEILSEDEARISPFDLGFSVGDGCFESLVTYDRMPFAFSRHHARLMASAEAMGMNVDSIPSKEELFQAVRTVIERNKLADPMCIRIAVTSGLSLLGLLRCGAPCTVMVAAVPGGRQGDTCSVMTSSYMRNDKSPFKGIKTLSYIENMMILAEAVGKGMGEALLANTSGQICSGTISNVFWVQDGVVKTCPLEGGAFPGVTRGLVMELCRSLGIACVEAYEPFSSLQSLEEVFLTSSLCEVQPVAMIDDRRLFPGATTMRLRKAFADLIDDSLDP